MNSEVVIALISLIGTLGGSLLGILVTNQLVNYRLEQLEKKVNLHNSVIERMYVAEGQIAELQHEVIDLKKLK